MNQRLRRYFFSCPQRFGTVSAEDKDKARDKVRKDCNCKKKCKVIIK